MNYLILLTVIVALACMLVYVVVGVPLVLYLSVLTIIIAVLLTIKVIEPLRK